MSPATVARSIAVAGALVLVALIALPPAGADEEPAPSDPRGLVDVSGHVRPLESELSRHERAPQHGGHDGALTMAWKTCFKRRVGRMRRRVKDLQSNSGWVTDKTTGDIVGLVPVKWSPFVRNLSALHTELGTCEDGYRKTRVEPEPAMRRWLRAHPGPLPIGRVPSRDALDEVDLAIRQLQIQNLVVPPRLWESRRRLAALVGREEERAREERRREYEEARRQTHEAIEASVTMTRERRDAIANALADGMTSLRALMATVQRIEEDRLQAMLADLPEDEKRDAEVKKLLAKMMKSRPKAVGFAGKRLARYGAEIQQGWMVPRSKLLKLIEKARKADAE